MAVNARALVRPPSKKPLDRGLFTVAEMRTATGPDASKWQLGVTWQNTCPDAGTTYDNCIVNNAVGITSLPVTDPKEATAFRSLWGATPFTVVVEIDCSPPGFWEDVDTYVDTVFGEAEQETVEAVFASGTVNGSPNTQYPHLSSTGELLDGVAGDTYRATLQLATANVGPSGAGVLDIVEALGRLDEALSSCVKGEGVIHVPTVLAAHLKANHLVTEDAGVWYSPGGHRIAIGAGYTGAAPTGVVTSGVAWMYGTGPVFIYKSRGRFIGSKKESFDHSVDTLKRIYERTYVIGYDCCLFGVAVSTGGVITGAVNSAT